MEIMKEWEETMSDFTPDAMLTFELEKGGIDVFVENIQIQTTLRGAYFVSYKSTDKIDFEIIAPNGSKLFIKV